MSAAFFDIDGTLVAKPSLERRLFWELRRDEKIPARNYLQWLAEVARLGIRNPRDLRTIVQTNKSYLRGVQAEILSRVTPSHATSSNATPSHVNSSHATSSNTTSPNARADNATSSSNTICSNTTTSNTTSPDINAGIATSSNAAPSSATAGSGDRGGAIPGSWLPELFPAAIQRVWWHALRGDAIVLVSGTLAPLAEIVQFALERELLWRGVECKIISIATKLEIANGCWTGGVVGAAVFGEEKTFAVKEFALAQNILLARCSAYGDSSLDRWMLAEVGHAFAVNPTRRLRRIARSRSWPILHWTHCALRTASEQRTAGEHRNAGEQSTAVESSVATEERGPKKSLKLKREAAR